MGGRGSGGSRGGGGGGSAKTNSLGKEIKELTNEDLRNMSDTDLKKAYASTKTAWNNEKKKREKEAEKLDKMTKEINKYKDDDPNYSKASKEFDAQLKKVTAIDDRVEKRQWNHYGIINERNNVRPNLKKSDIKSMSKEQLRSYSQKEYREYHKARRLAETSNNKAKIEKYTKIAKEHSNNYDKAYESASKNGYNVGESNW